MKLSILDAIMPQYKVVDDDGYALGEKMRVGAVAIPGRESSEPLYLKPEYSKKGNRIGGKWGSFESRLYKATPPWFQFEVLRIDDRGGSITVHVHAKKHGEGA